jgi:hypothetical protein
VRWYGGRGRRLADVKCVCGGALRSKTAGLASHTAGHHFAQCAYCGRRRLDTKLVTLPRPMWLIGRELPAGAAVCGFHELAQPGGKQYAHRAGTDYLLVSVAEHVRRGVEIQESGRAGSAPPERAP